jgi:hypothetical protein
VLVLDAAGRGNLLMSEPDWLPDARELRGRQMGYQRIASRLGVSRHVVYYWLHRDRERARSQAKNPAQRARRRAARPARRVEVCHTGWHHRRVTIYRDVFTEDEWAWLTTQELRGQNVIAWLDDRYPSRDHPPRPGGECRA